MMNPKNKIEYPDAPENPYVSTGYVRLPEAREVIQKIKKEKRALAPSPLLAEFMNKQEEKKR